MSRFNEKDAAELARRAFRFRVDDPEEEQCKAKKAAPLLGKEVQLLVALREAEQAYDEWIGELPFHTRRAADGRPMVGTLKLQAYAQSFLKQNVTEKRIGGLFRELGAERKRQDGAHWILPSLPDARRAWNESRFKTAWDDAKDWHIPAVEWPSKEPF